MKVAVYCPRLPGEAETAWQTRIQACRLYLRAFPMLHSLEFDSLDHLQMHYPRHAFRRVLVALAGYYPLDFRNWAARERVPVLDVMDRGEQTEEIRQRSATLAEKEAHRAARWN